MRAVGYIRVSTEDQAREGVSLEAQRAKIEQYAALRDMDLLEIVEDPGISAKDLRRPGVKRILELARRRKVEAIVVLKLDRMFRSTEDALQTTRRFDKWGISFHSILETLDSKSAMGRFFFTLTAALAEMERSLVAERTRAALAHKRTKGEKTGGDVPFGYDLKGGVLVENEAEQRILKRILKARGRGLSLRRIARGLEAKGIRTKRGGASWHPQTLKQLLGRAA